MPSIVDLVNQYGYFILFGALVLELIALPLPGELIMTYTGFLVYQNKLNWFLSMLFAASGAIVGVTISYFAGGVLGEGFFKKYGSYIHLGPGKIEKTSVWFNSYGNLLLILAYFIPGVRHITGYFSGITKISYKKFSINAYLGAIIWSSTFISLGKFLGLNWEKFHSSMSRYLIIGCLLIALILIILYIYRNHRTQIVEFTYKFLSKALLVFHSMGRIKVAIAAVVVALLGFFVLVIGLTQDYFANELNNFDMIVTYLINEIFVSPYSYTITLFDAITSVKVLVLLTTVLSLWIMIKNIDRLLEIRFLFFVIGGGEILQIVLRYIFRRIGPSSIELPGISQYTFPDSQSLMAIAAYGFIAYIILRHSQKTWLRPVIISLTLLICIFAGLNPLFYQIAYPSDVYAGYIFGGLWLTLNIVLLEVYRILPKIQ